MGCDSVCYRTKAFDDYTCDHGVSVNHDIISGLTEEYPMNMGAVNVVTEIPYVTTTLEPPASITM
jgi:uncharacterized membrane protein